MRLNKVTLPNYPIVIADGRIVNINFADGTNMVWGEEETPDEALLVARELEIELRGVNFVKWHVKNFIDDMKALLSELDIDEHLLDSILLDGHNFAMQELKIDLVLTNIDKKEIKKMVWEKLGTDQFII